MRFWDFWIVLVAIVSSASAEEYGCCTSIGGHCGCDGMEEKCKGSDIMGFGECKGYACCVDNIAARCLFCIRPEVSKPGKPSNVPLCEQDAECTKRGGVCQWKDHECAEGMALNSSYACAQRRVCCMGTCPALVHREVWKAVDPTAVSTHTTLLPIVVIHQTACCTQYLSCKERWNKLACVGDIMKAIQRKHMSSPMDLIDMGYDYVIDPAGRVWKGSKMVINPGITRDYPGETLNIAIMGNFEVKAPCSKNLGPLDLLLKCLVKDKVIDPDYVVHADYHTAMCGEKLYDYTVTHSHYQTYLTADEKVVYTAALEDKALMVMLNETTELFCEMYKNDPSINGKPPCVPDCPKCLPEDEVKYILSYLDNPEAAHDFYVARGKNYKEQGYTRENLKKYIEFNLERLVKVILVRDLYLTAYSKMFQFKYQVLLDAML